MDWIRLIKNIPRRFREEQSEQLTYANQHKDAYRWIYLNEDIRFCCPSDVLATWVWRFHAFTLGGRAELFSFLKLAEGCTRLLDVGASAGIFSALFANTRSKAEILAVEPDVPSFKLLNETASLNSPESALWRFSPSVISHEAGPLKFTSTGFGGDISAEGESVQGHTLASLCAVESYVPDLLKMDIESYEYEALLASEVWLRQHRPKIFLELHFTLLKQRGKDAQDVVTFLNRLGYQPVDGGSFEQAVKSTLDHAGCARLALVMKN